MVEQNGVQVRSSYHAHRPATASRDHMRWFSRRLRRRFSIVLDSITPTNPASNFVFRCTNQTRAHDDECRER